VKILALLPHIYSKKIINYFISFKVKAHFQGLLRSMFSTLFCLFGLCVILGVIGFWDSNLNLMLLEIKFYWVGLGFFILLFFGVFLRLISILAIVLIVSLFFCVSCGLVGDFVVSSFFTQLGAVC